jgi:FkbM family methyltransferase
MKPATLKEFLSSPHRPRIGLSIKNRIKLTTRKVFAVFKVQLVFNGERSEKGLYPYFLEFFLAQSKGVLHVGGHFGQESAYYEHMLKPVLWIEADPGSFVILSQNIAKVDNQIAVNALVSDTVREETMHVTSNNGMSSSVHPLSSIGKVAFDIQNTHTIQLTTNTLNNLLPIEGLTLDFWVIDVQGHEYQVLRGGDKVISHARWILIEGSNRPYYDNMALFPEVKNLLETYGFIQVYCPRADHFEALFMNTKN